MTGQNKTIKIKIFKPIHSSNAQALASVNIPHPCILKYKRI